MARRQPTYLLRKILKSSVWLICMVLAIATVCTQATQAAEPVFLPSSSTEIPLQNTYPGKNTFLLGPARSISSQTEGISGDNAQNWDITNYGTIVGGQDPGQSGSGIKLGAATTNQSIVRNYGSITSVRNAGSGPSGIRFTRGGQVYNYAGGLIQGFDGIHTDGGGVLVENYGTIQGSFNGGSGIYSGQGALIRNFEGGLISGENFGININGPDRNTSVYNYGIIDSDNTAIHITAGNDYTVLNAPSGRITSNKDGVSFAGDNGYLLNQGVIQVDRDGVTATTASAGDVYVNTGSIVAGRYGISLTGDGNSIYNLSTLSGGTSAVTIAGSDNLLVLGMQAYLPRLGYSVTGPGSNLVGDAVVTSGTGNRILLTESGSEDSALTGFQFLTMNGEDWTLSNPLTLDDGTNPGILTVQNGRLSLTGNLTTANSGNVLVTNGGTLSLYQGLTTNTVNIVEDGVFEYGGTTGNFASMDINAASGGLFRLSRQDSRLTLASSVNLNLAPGSFFGVTISPDPTSHSILYMDTFAPAEGVGLDVNGHTDHAIGISSLPAGGNYYQGVVQATLNPVSIPNSMRITNNPLVSAAMVVNPGNANWADLNLELRNINDVYGPHLEAADVWRLSSLPTPLQRRWLDAIYRTGRLGDRGLEYFQVLDGHNVLAVPEALRANLRHFTGDIGDRLETIHDMRLSTPKTALGNAASRPAPASYTPDPLHLDDIQTASGPVEYTSATAYDNATLNRAQYTTWAAASHRWSQQDQTDNILGYDYNPVAFTFGVDRVQGPWVLGFAVQYGQGDVNASTDSGPSARTTIESALGGVYAAYQTPNWYGQAGLQFGYAWNETQTTYSVWRQESHADYASTLFGADTEFGYNLYFGDAESPFRLTPHLGLTYGRIHQEGFSEKGSASVTRSFDANTYEVVEVPVGVRITKAIELDQAILTPHIDLAYVHNFGDEQASGMASFTELADQTWRVYGPDSGRDALRLSLGMDAKIGQYLDMGLSYTMEARDTYLDQGAKLEIGLTF